MKFKPQTLYTVQCLNAFLLQGNEAAIAQCLEAADLEDLLSDDTLTKTRARSKSALVILLSSLAASNDINVVRATWWRDVYQSVATQSLKGKIVHLEPSNVLRMVIQAAGEKKPLLKQALMKVKGPDAHWLDAFELALDTHQWTTAQNMLERLGSMRAETKLWLQLSKSLAFRHKLIADHAKPEDHQRIARMYELMQLALRHAGALDSSQSLLLLRGSALQEAGAFDQAIEVFKKLEKAGNTVAAQIEISRSLCKRGDLLGSIQWVDQVIANHRKFSVGVDEVSELDDLLPSNAVVKFNVSNANVALADLVAVLGQAGQKIFLVSGTLLGYEREGKLMDHDKDIDVGVLGWQGQYEAVMALIGSKKFQVSPRYLKGANAYYIPVMHNTTGVWIDLFIYHEIEGKWVTGVDFFFGYRQTFAFTPFELKPINFLGVDMYVPDNAALNLEENFGNWRVPDPSYISHLESPSTMDKGGLAHMLTARLWAIRAIQARNPAKLGKVIEVLGQYPRVEGAVSETLMQELVRLHAQIVRESEIPSATVIEAEELAHA
jgi:hypothetical protein